MSRSESNKSVQLTQHLAPHIMPTINFMSREDISLPRLSVSIPMIARILLLVLNIIIIGIIGYYFAYYRGSYRHNLFDEELMMLVCAVSAFINTVIMVGSHHGSIYSFKKKYLFFSSFGYKSNMNRGQFSASPFRPLVSLSTPKL